VATPPLHRGVITNDAATAVANPGSDEGLCDSLDEEHLCRCSRTLSHSDRAPASGGRQLDGVRGD
jgi:hypothetical protein